MPEVKLIAAAPPEFPRLVTIPDPFPMVVVLLEVKVVKAPEPAVVAPTETKLATPPEVMLQLSSVKERPVVDDEPMAMVLAIAPVPMFTALAFVAPVPMLIVSAPVPVPRLMVLVTESVVPMFKVVAAPAKLTVVAVALTRLNVVAAVTISPPSTARSLVTPNPPAVLIEPVEPEVESVASLCLRIPAVISIALFAVDAPLAVSNKAVFVFVVPVLVTEMARP